MRRLPPCIKSVWAWHVPAGIQQQSQPTSGLEWGMVPAAPGAAAVKQRNRQRAQAPAWISHENPQLRRSPTAASLPSTPLSPHRAMASSAGAPKPFGRQSGPPMARSMAEPGAAEGPMQQIGNRFCFRSFLQLPARHLHGHQEWFQAVGSAPISWSLPAQVEADAVPGRWRFSTRRV